MLGQIINSLDFDENEFPRHTHYHNCLYKFSHLSEGKKLAENIWKVAVILGESRKSESAWSPSKYELQAFSVKEYLAHLYQDAFSDDFIQTNIGRSLLLQEQCLSGFTWIEEYSSRSIDRRWIELITSCRQSDEDRIRELISRIRNSTTIPYAENLADRLLILFNDEKEEEPDSPGISPGSINNFYNLFIQSRHNLKYPFISLTPNHSIYASWRVDQNRVFSVHFLPSEHVRFVIFKPNDKHPEQQIRISGVVTTDLLMDTVESHGVIDWISS